MQISINLGTNHCWVKEILNCSNKESGPLQRGDNYKNVKMGWGLFKDLLKNHKVRRDQVYMKAF
jgi:hypothetical protein